MTIAEILANTVGAVQDETDVEESAAHGGIPNTQRNQEKRGIAGVCEGAATCLGGEASTECLPATELRNQMVQKMPNVEKTRATR